MKKKKSLILRCIKLLTALAVLGATVFFAGAYWPLAIPEVTSRPERLMFTNLALVDVESGNVITGQSILIENGQIAEIGSHISSGGAQLVDGQGRRFLGLEGKAGVLKTGARADMVLLVANPLVDIQAARDVDAVVLAGAYYDRAALDQMLAGVESAAGSWSMWPKFAWQILRSPVMMKQFAD